MQAKLYKREDKYDLYSEDDHKIASSAPNTFGKLSKQNCDEIFWGLYDTEIEVMIEMEKVVDETKVIGAVKGVKGSGHKITTCKSVPKLDSEGCLILKKI
jgi:hypothetical protein